ncbi:MAG: hypothetical protein JJU46_11255 [Balneolaceae bacterium]|nr:hypothetical protein [Balneolaceae bacterium]MCH8548843.1 methyl-accepting chemotaxis protein [Balneolaceae bacterium]
MIQANEGTIKEKLFPAFREDLPESVKKSLYQTFVETDRFMLNLLLLHWVVASTLTAFSYGTYLLGFIGGGLIYGVARLVFSINPGSAISRSVMGVAFMGFSLIFIQQHMGRIEMHFHIFVAIAFLLRYKDITPLIAAAAATALHHGLFNIAQDMEMAIAGTPIMIFDYGCGWDIVALHATFVVVEVVAFSLISLSLTREYIRNAEVFTIMDQLGDSVMHTSQAADFISSSGQELAINAADNAQAVEKSNRSIDEMSGVIGQLNEKTTGAREKMVLVSKKSEQMNRSMASVRDSSQNISGIVATIDGIASQTNMLALNAAIEAARAGEAGAGFTVVTEEVRRLAQQTAMAANEIGSLIDSNSEKAEEGATMSTEILNQIKDLDGWLEEVCSVSESQTGKLNELKGIISEISSTTESTADNAERNAATAEELQSQVHLLQEAIDEINETVALNMGEDSGSGKQYDSEQRRDVRPVNGVATGNGQPKHEAIYIHDYNNGVKTKIGFKK